MNLFKYKVLLLGAPAVGKTSVLYRFFKNAFKENYSLTIGVQVLTKDVTFTNATIKLTVWDIGGQARFKDLRKTYYLGTHGALLIFDLTRKDTFTDLDTWIKELHEIIGAPVPFILIGNKLDLISEKGRPINPNEIKLFAKEHNCIYIETSAKTGEHIKDAFKELILTIIKNKGREKDL